ncbi:LLM class flavin-dependent oxidoreductase [Amycolatopsis cihanbeyliensis]|uniref:Methylenetetrahydromethanopterin reductase n=1 Tax=Amycolatopsis cihanbeyliensis TaxID=1128664 RepID=A0A542DCY7_AMYCI|nr:LLM class flavin-dependent oxidoreductase [Amycolatopsis cihanbeyliensis]TQJ00933.1 methylenetetrahydromethanopterin reductase [Amycolatopsis cihanbeyliensis]
MRYLLQLHGNLPIDAYPELAGRAEELGFEDITVHDVLLRRPVWPVLCDLARATSRPQLGPNVTHPYLTHPAQLAANLAHLDELSGGRAVLGIGRGSMYELLGMRNPATLAGVREAIDVIRALVGGDGGGHQGATFTLADTARLHFGTGRRVPVYLGALGPKGARLAGAHCDGLRVAAQWDPAYPSMLAEHVAAGAKEVGRDPGEVDFVVENWTFVHPDREYARRGARRVLATFLPHLGPLLTFHGVPEAEVEAARAAVRDGATERLEEISDRTVDLFMAAGDAGDLAAGLDKLADAGFGAVSFSGELGPETGPALELIGNVLSSRRG